MLIDDWRPVTSDFGLIEAPVETTVAGYVAWRSALGDDLRHTPCARIEEAMGGLPPLSAEMRRAVVVPTTSTWTAFFQSGIQGSDPFPIMSELARRLGVRAMRVCSTPASAPWPATIWEVYAPPSLGGAAPLGYLRSIAASNDGGRWVFEQSGTPFPFERLEAYATRRPKRSRFTHALLVEYLAALGLRPFDDDFYAVTATSPAVILENHRRWKTPAPEFTLDEVQRGVPWSRPAAP